MGDDEPPEKKRKKWSYDNGGNNDIRKYIVITIFVTTWASKQ